METYHTLSNIEKLGAIFDFDGVLFHSERQHEACWQEVAREEGLPMSREQFLRGFGVKNELFIREILDWTTDPQEIARIIDKKEKLFQKHLKTSPLDLIAGTVDLAVRLNAAHVPCAIGSSSVRKNIDLVMAPYPDLRALFSVISSGEDVAHGKPDPEVFLQAARRLRIPSSHCIVFEDAPLGIEAAKRAGMKVVVLTTTFLSNELQIFYPDLLVDSLSSVSVQDLFELFKKKII
jgi:beta-phosphoglucomutase-like phosphatase (HAD superfamily)